MKHPLRSAVTTTGRRMAGARSLWRANGMREEQFGRPIIGIAALARDHRRQRRIHGQRPLHRRTGVHQQLRQDHARNADGRHAAQHSDGLRFGRADGSGPFRRPRRRPDRRDGDGRRRPLQRRGGGTHRTLRLPGLRVVFGDVHRQLDELPHRSAGTLAAGQRHDRRHARRAPPAVRRGRRAHRPQRRTLLLRRRRLAAAALDRHEGGLRERHVARHRHGRLDQHRAAPAGRGPRGGRGLHDARHRPPLAQGTRAVQGRTQLALPYSGCQPRRRHPLDPGRTRPRETRRHLRAADRRPHAGRGDRRLRPAQRDGGRRRPRPLAKCPRRQGRPAAGRTGHPLRNARHRPRGGLHPRHGARLFPRRRAGRADGQHRPLRLRRQDRRRRRKTAALPRAGPRL